MYQMKANHDCGLAMLSELTNKPYKKIARLMGYKLPVSDSIFSDLRDNPYNHFRVLGRLGINYKLVDVAKWESGQVVGRTAVLIHNTDSLWKSWLVQHWIIVERLAGKNCIVEMGDGRQSFLSLDELKKMYVAGFPNCAYQINVPQSEAYTMKWWQRMLSKIFS